MYKHLYLHKKQTNHTQFKVQVLTLFLPMGKLFLQVSRTVFCERKSPAQVVSTEFLISNKASHHCHHYFMTDEQQCPPHPHLSQHSGGLRWRQQKNFYYVCLSWQRQTWASGHRAKPETHNLTDGGALRDSGMCFVYHLSVYIWPVLLLSYWPRHSQQHSSIMP